MNKLKYYKINIPYTTKIEYASYFGDINRNRNDGVHVKLGITTIIYSAGKGASYIINDYIRSINDIVNYRLDII